MSFRSWIELESDPGLFTLLVYDFGVKGVEVEEVYDLSKPIERPVLGFIFLFKWTEERKTRRKAAVPEENFVLDQTIENDMFFAQQLIPNSCASHALLSVLLNVPDVSLGYTLKKLRDSCKGFDSETKGHAIGNFWNIAVAHNNHGRPELRWHADRTKNVTASRSMEAFHYVSYIPCNGKLFELDGLKPHPIDHGPWSSEETWSDKARRVIQERIQIATGGELSHDIRYNLLAVVPEQLHVYKEKMDVLNHNKKVLIEIFKKLAGKQTFVTDASTVSILKTTDVNHPFPERKLFKRKRKSGKSVSFVDRQTGGPLSPQSTSSSTLTGHESQSRMFSDSDDGSVNTYRIKSMMRCKSPVVYVYGETNSSGEINEKIDDQKSAEEKITEKITDSKPDFCEIESKRGAKQLKTEHDMENSIDDVPLSESVIKQETTEVGTNETDTAVKSHPSDGDVEMCENPSENNLENIIKKEEQCIESKQNENLMSSFSITTTNGNESQSNHETKNVSDEQTHEVVEKVNLNESATQNEETENESTTHNETIENSEDIKEVKESVQPGIGVEIVADDVDIQALLEQKNVTRLALENVLKYEDHITLQDLQKCMQELDELYNFYQNSYKEELEKLERYKIDDCRRRHNYEPFVATFLSMLAEQGHLSTLLDQQHNNTATNLKKSGVVKGVVKGTFPKKDVANAANNRNKKKKRLKRK